MSIDLPLYSKDDQEWFSAEFRVWRDTRDLVFMFDLLLPVLTDMPLPVDILRAYTLDFEIRDERALTNLRECLRKAVRDRDCNRELANTLMEDIEEMSSVHENELTAFKEKLDRRGPALPGTEAECLVKIPSRRFGGRADSCYSEICHFGPHLRWGESHIRGWQGHG